MSVADEAHEALPADSAGQPWWGRDLTQNRGPYHRFAQDTGVASRQYLQARDRLFRGKGSERLVVESLLSSRVFVPVVSSLGGTQATVEHGDKRSETVLPFLQAHDGRRALPVFSSSEALAQWQERARPVAVFGPRAALSACTEGAELMVVDPGSSSAFVVRRPALWALAQERHWKPSYTDPEVADRVRALVQQVAMKELGAECDTMGRRSSELAIAERLVDVKIVPDQGICSTIAEDLVVPGGGSGPELRVTLVLRGGLPQSTVDVLSAAIRANFARDDLFVERVDSVYLTFCPL